MAVQAYINSQPVSGHVRRGWRKSYHFYTVPQWYPVPFKTWTFQTWYELDAKPPKRSVVTIMYETSFN